MSTDDLIWKMTKFKLNPPQNRFFGKSRFVSRVGLLLCSVTQTNFISSGFHLIQAALEHKHEFTGVPKKDVKPCQKRKEFWETPPVCLRLSRITLKVANIERDPSGLALIRRAMKCTRASISRTTT
jgi:hypothetical protein